MLKKQYRAYLFDLDGTLINTINLILDCFHFSLDYAAGLKVDDRKIRAHIGLPLRKQFEVYLGHLEGIDYKDVMRRHMDYQIEHWKGNIYVYEGVKEVLRELKNRGKKTAIVTSRQGKTASLYAEGMGLRRFFDALITPEATKHHKPHPAPVQKAMQALKSQPEETIFIGDSPFDIQCGHHAGCDTAFIRPGEDPDLKMKVEPTFRLREFEELL